jgi:hypothetical protein
MARLFITPREIDFISDITKEIIKDVVGQRVFYYHVREDVSEVHDVYEEAVEKIFDNPVEIDARIEWQDPETSTTNFGVDQFRSATAYFQYSDLLDKEIELEEGDFVSFGQFFYEILKINIDQIAFGQVEYPIGFKVELKQARKGIIDRRPLGPTEEIFTDEDAVQETFVQQRGFEENILGKTADKRKLVEQGKIDLPEEGPRQVSPKGDEGGFSSSFYDEKE